MPSSPFDCRRTVDDEPVPADQRGRGRASDDAEVRARSQAVERSLEGGHEASPPERRKSFADLQ